MRTSLLKKKFESLNATFEERFETEVVKSVSTFEKEYSNIRESAGVTDFSFMQCYSVPEESGLDFLDSIFPGNVAKIRFGRVLHTFLANENGEIISDCYIANNDEEFIILMESIVEDSVIDDIFKKNGSDNAVLKKLSGEYSIIGVDGFKSWKIAKELFGMDVLGLPYLSLELYNFEDEEIKLIRAGKTSEFGYLFLVSNRNAEALFSKSLELAEAEDGGACGVEIHNKLRLEGRFFNIFKEGAIVKNPLSLGLQWMIDFDKDSFLGSEIILRNRGNGLKQKIIGVSSDVEEDSLVEGANIFNGAESVAKIVTVCFSPVLKKNVALALFNINYAFSGLDFSLAPSGDLNVKTISMPPIIPKSLSVKLDEM